MRPPIVLRPCAKLNLTLEVLNRRDDGYHAVRSVMVPIDLCDELEITPADGPLEFVCDQRALESDNLVMRAWNALGLPASGYRIELRKNIPLQAGLGGGSSDAAAVLLAAQDGAFGDPGQRDYLGVARSLGSDVPFFLAGTGALVEGTGERITAIGALPDWHAVVVKPPAAVSTAEAYRAIDAQARPSRPRNASVSIRMAEAVQAADFAQVQSLVSNDFHDVLLSSTPTIRAAVDALAAAGARNPSLTGSGSCVFALAPARAEAEAMAARMRLGEGFTVHICAFQTSHAWRRA